MTFSVAALRLPQAGSVRGWRLPDRTELRTYLAYAAVVAILFFAGYGGANWLASLRANPTHLYLAAELAIPIWPAMIWVYLSINLLFILPVFALDVPELRLLGRRMIAGTVIAVGIFLIMPTTLGFERLDLSANANPAFDLLYALDHPFNCLPSLHVTYSTLLIAALARQGRPWLRTALIAWLLLIIASTLLTHQHHLADILAALLLVASLHLAFGPTTRETDA
jgi:membrane-associated phospholipid phosphatase